MSVPAISELNPPSRTLLGPGPSMVPPRVFQAMTHPLLGYLDPEFFKVMADIQTALRAVFQTVNPLTLPLSGTGSAGMEAALCNFIEPGDDVLVGVNGFFGERLVEIAGRYGARVNRLDRAWGEVFTPDEVEDAVRRKAYKLVALVHAETSTGTLQPDVAEIASAVHRHGGLLVLDTVTSLGGVPVEIDAWDVDVAYSGSQKCLSCPPGLAPFTVGPRGREALRSRRSKVANWYLDLTLLEKYWGSEHAYHHTVPIALLFGLREALRLALEEGLEARWARHRANAELLWAGLESLGFPLHVPAAHRNPALTTCSSAGLDDAAFRRRLLDEYNVEIAGGFGPLKGKIFRIGLMGFSSRRENVALLLAALKALRSGG